MRRRSFICSCSGYIPTTDAPSAGRRCSLFGPIARGTHRSSSASCTTMAACSGCTRNGERSCVRTIRKTSCGSSASHWKSAREAAKESGKVEGRIKKLEGVASAVMASVEWIGSKRIFTGRLRGGNTLQQLEFVPARVEVRDFVARRFQSSLQIENLRARFRIKIRRGKRSFQIRHFVFRGENSRLH